ncbi:MAG: hypothetical protein B6247_22830 [Candidatus Parabeggiatoa sp. nov. 2]|nr:MAG: hypothetical protein B6247_22830 [Beggiatoa sp. 4572_84]
MSILQSKSHDFASRYAAMQAREQQRWQHLLDDGIENWADRFEQIADQRGEYVLVQEVGQDRVWSYRDLDQAADKIAAWARHTDAASIGVCQNNGAVFLATVLGLAKAGIPAVLFNTHEPAQRLALLAEHAQLKFMVGLAIEGLAVQSPNALVAQPWPGRICTEKRRSVKLDDPVVIIFTSGTSGPSKPALFSHRRLIGAGIAWALRNNFNAKTRCYIPLPLCHGNGLAVAFASCVEAGGCAVVRERFSVHSFIADIRRYHCNSTVYVGELWSYLMNTPAQADDADNPLQVIFGNGLSAELWPAVIQRFGISHVVEHFGATEMPAAALTNWFDVHGYCGYIPPLHPDAADVLLVDEAGKPVPVGVAGQALLRVSGGRYRGYLNPAMDVEKLWPGLLEPDDLWWKSGDILRRDASGFFSFVERSGDNFRWKGENISATEVETAIQNTDLVREVIVYGITIPGAVGKAGMASVVPKPVWGQTQLAQLLASLQVQLPSYAVPLVLRLLPDWHATTATLKIPKARFATDGFQDIDKYPHFILLAGRYVQLDQERLMALNTGQLCLGFHPTEKSLSITTELKTQWLVEETL